MKKKILVCIQNYFAASNITFNLSQLAKEYDVTLIASNYLLDEVKIKNIKLKKEHGINNLYIIPFYKTELQRPVSTVILTHRYILKLKKDINFKDFDMCISDNKFFIWQRIILEKFLDKKCLQVGMALGSIPLHLEKFKELLMGKNIVEIIKSVHKLREIKNVPGELKVKSNKKINIRINNFLKRIIDVYLDRIFISYFLYGRNFKYDIFDFNTGAETKNFSYKITFHYATHHLWSKWYNNKKVILSKVINKCQCVHDSNKILFISSLLWEDDDSKLNIQIKKMSKFIEKIKLENPNLNEIDIRHHPMEKFNALNTINKKINSIIGPIIKVNILNNTMSISEIGCNYKIAFGMMSSALFDARASCEKIKVYCIKSLSMGRNDLDNNYFLKLLNEDIIFFDDDNDQIDQNYLKYKSLLPKVEKQDFMEFIKSILL